MPSHDLLEDALGACLDHVAVAWDQSVEIPTRNRATAARERRPIALASHVPNEPPLPNGRATRVLEAVEELGKQPIGGRLARSGVLFIRRQVEDHVGRDEGPIGSVIEHKFLVGMTAHVYIVKLTVEVRVNFQTGRVLRREDPGEFRASRGRVRFTLLRQTLDTQDFCRRECFGPVREEDVMLIV